VAGERDEHVLGRLIRGIASPVQVIAGKLALGVVLAVGFSVGLFVVFAVLAPQAWTRLPLLLACVVLAGATCSALGALLATLTRDARTATLVGILVVLPLAPLALLGSMPTAHAVSQLAPLAPAQHLFNAVLFDASPWGSMAGDAGVLLVQLVVFGFVSLRLVRRLA
jgi:ABC-type multidrug transport system permease subunit